jgi:hypothetical protein
MASPQPSSLWKMRDTIRQSHFRTLPLAPAKDNCKMGRLVQTVTVWPLRHNQLTRRTLAQEMSARLRTTTIRILYRAREILVLIGPGAMINSTMTNLHNPPKRQGAGCHDPRHGEGPLCWRIQDLEGCNIKMGRIELQCLDVS